LSLPCLNYLINSLSNTNLSLKNVEIPSKYDDCSSINIGKDEVLEVNKRDYYDFIETIESLVWLETRIKFKEIIIMNDGKLFVEI